jgi:RNA polymerase sigma-70 factor (ECF subfamily)
MKRTNEQWLSDLRESGSRQENALSDLRTIILNGLPYALNKWLPYGSPHLDPLVEESAQETLLRVLDHLDTFEGRSQFTTWVHKIAVRVALTELRRRKWRDISLDDLMERKTSNATISLLADQTSSPETNTEQTDMFEIVSKLISEELTEKQRTAMVAITIHKMPIEEVARRMKTNRNALYKLLHDARLRLKNRLSREGLTPEAILKAFE